MRLKFHGGRGSHPVCTPPARIQEITRAVWDFAQKRKLHSWTEVEKALAHEPRALSQIYGGNTTCVEIKSPALPMPLFIDAGTGFTAASLDPTSGLNNAAFKKNQGEAAILFSHTHWDHIVGLITAEQIFKDGNHFHFYGVHKKLGDRIQTLFREEHFPVPYRLVEPRFHFNQIKLGADLKLKGVTVQHFGQSHPGGSFAYRVSDGKKTLVFATDTELKNVGKPHLTPGKNIYSDADVLVLDAQFSPEDITSKEGFGHAQIFTAVDFAVRERAKRLYLFHQAPGYSDSAIDEQLLRARDHLLKKHGKGQKLEVYMTVEGEEVGV